MGSAPAEPAPEGNPPAPSGSDLLEWPVLGAVLRWRHTRTVLQSAALGLAVLLLLDGLFGPQLAPRNLAGVIPWVHWRGFVVLGLLVAGNLFCMACPFMLPRRIAKRFLPADRVWPRFLRSKWLAVALLGFFFWAYEAFALWSSPWLTAWVALTYFAGAFVVDGFFRGASFCRFVCPIGQFNFVHSTVSPLEVGIRDPARCESCTTKDCIRGRYASQVQGQHHPVDEHWNGRPIQPSGPGGELALTRAVAGAAAPAPGRTQGREGLLQGGCELALFQPRKEGNLDCTFCLECIHACPHGNVGIFTRSPARELTVDPVRSGVGRISRRPDLAAMALLLVFAAYVNAFGMVEPVFALQEGIAGALRIRSHGLLLLVFFLGGLVILPGLLVGSTAWASRRVTGGTRSLAEEATVYAWMLIPVGFGMWAAHYLFHFLVGALTVLPVAQQYLRDLGLPSGDPAWGLGPVVPEGWLLPIELLFLQGGLLVSLLVGYRLARREEGAKGPALRAFVPWALLATLLAGSGIWLLQQPMEMRGTFFAG
jgi:polyferredoxin